MINDKFRSQRPCYLSFIIGHLSFRVPGAPASLGILVYSKGLTHALLYKTNKEEVVGKKLFWIVVIFAFISWPVNGQDAKSVLDNASKNMGTVKSIQYSGNGSSFSVGQSINPNGAWPRAFNLKSYTRVINYDTMSSREE